MADESAAAGPDPNAAPIPMPPGFNPFAGYDQYAGYDPFTLPQGAGPGTTKDRVAAYWDALQRGKLTDPTASLPVRLGQATLQHFFNQGQGLYNAALAPGRAMRGEITPEEAQGQAFGLATSLIGPGMGRAVSGEGGLGMFGGPLSSTADLPALSRAVRWKRQGVSADDIRDATGWFPNAAGEWRNEFSDALATLTGKLPKPSTLTSILGPGGTMPLSSVLNHPELYKAYPDIANLPVGVRRMSNLGEYYNVEGTPPAGMIAVKAGGQPDLRGTLLHEIQHWIQDYEGSPMGGPPRTIPSKFDAQIADMDRFMSRPEARSLLTPEEYAKNRQTLELYDEYKSRLAEANYRAAGIETEARNTQMRKDMPMETRQLQQFAPWRTQDIGSEYQKPLKRPATEAFLLGQEPAKFYRGPDTPQTPLLFKGGGLGPMGLTPTQAPAPAPERMPEGFNPFFHEEAGTMPIDQIKRTPAVAAAYMNPQIVRDKPVPFGAGASKTSGTTYIDPQIPQFHKDFIGWDGQPLWIDKYLAIHEQTEKAGMEGHLYGYKPGTYKDMHKQVAGPAEEAAIRADGGDPKVYNRVLKPYLDTVKKQSLKLADPDLYAKPYLEEAAPNPTLQGGQGEGGKQPAGGSGVKVLKSTADYRNSPKGAERCDGCSMFVKPNGCTAVKGHIMPQGWCKYWEAKK